MEIIIFPFRGCLAPSKVEKLVVLKENRKLVNQFKMKSDYKLVEGGVNAFGLVEAVLEEGEGEGGEAEGVEEEDIELFYDDLEEDFEEGLVRNFLEEEEI